MPLLESFTLLTLGNPLIMGVIIGVIRCVLGYLEAISKEGTDFDFRKMLATIFRTIPQYIGLDALVPGAGVGALVTDYAISKAKKK